LIWNEVVAQLSDETRLRAMLEEREAARRSSRKDDEVELETLCSLEAGLKTETAKLLDYALSDVIDRATLQERMAVVRQKQDAITTAKNEVVRRLTEQQNTTGNAAAINKLCELAREGLPHLDFGEKRAFLEAMDVKITVDGDRLTVTGLVTERTLSMKGALLCHGYAIEAGISAYSYRADARS
jgi:hypothetical protein